MIVFAPCARCRVFTPDKPTRGIYIPTTFWERPRGLGPPLCELCASRPRWQTAIARARWWAFHLCWWFVMPRAATGSRFWRRVRSFLDRIAQRQPGWWLDPDRAL